MTVQPDDVAPVVTVAVATFPLTFHSFRVIPQMLFNYLRTDRDGQMAMHWEKKCIAPAMNKKRTKKKLHQNLITVIPALHNSLKP